MSRLRELHPRGAEKTLRAKVVDDFEETVPSDTTELMHLETHVDCDKMHKSKPSDNPTTEEE